MGCCSIFRHKHVNFYKTVNIWRLILGIFVNDKTVVLWQKPWTCWIRKLHMYHFSLTLLMHFLVIINVIKLVWTLLTPVRCWDQTHLYLDLAEYILVMVQLPLTDQRENWTIQLEGTVTLTEIMNIHFNQTAVLCMMRPCSQSLAHSRHAYR
jgi:hypothetical protein